MCLGDFQGTYWDGLIKTEQWYWESAVCWENEHYEDVNGVAS